jgi:hypothetical protein
MDAVEGHHRRPDGQYNYRERDESEQQSQLFRQKLSNIFFTHTSETNFPSFYINMSTNSTQSTARAGNAAAANTTGGTGTRTRSRQSLIEANAASAAPAPQSIGYGHPGRGRLNRRPNDRSSTGPAPAPIGNPLPVPDPPVRPGHLRYAPVRCPRRFSVRPQSPW